MTMQVMLAGENLADDVRVAHIADLAANFSGSDLRTLCTAAAMRPVREFLSASGKSATASSPPMPAAASRSVIPSARPPAQGVATGASLNYVIRYMCRVQKMCGLHELRSSSQVQIWDMACRKWCCKRSTGACNAFKRCD